MEPYDNADSSPPRPSVEGTRIARPVTLLRYLDVGIVLAAAPAVALAGAPFVGYAIGAAAWILARIAVEMAHARARAQRRPKLRAGMHVAGMMGRIFFAALAPILTKVLLGKATPWPAQSRCWSRSPSTS